MDKHGIDWSRTAGLRIKQKNHNLFGHISRMPITSHDNGDLIVVALDSGGIYWMNKNDWEPVDFSQPADWDGEGLPPVGTVCEITHSGWGHRGWERVTINYISTEYAITTQEHGEQHWHMRNVKFRPIRTPEQIAAEERAADIKAMCEHGIDAGDCTIEMTCAALHDAGYRKQPDN